MGIAQHKADEVMIGLIISGSDNWIDEIDELIVSTCQRLGFERDSEDFQAYVDATGWPICYREMTAQDIARWLNFIHEYADNRRTRRTSLCRPDHDRGLVPKL